MDLRDDTSPLLEIDRLTVRFGRRAVTAVNSLDLTVGPGERVGVIGESGSGKSVTALSVMGLLPENAHASGSVRLRGEQLLNQPDRILRGLRGSAISMIFQEPMTALDPTMRAGRQVAEALGLHGRRHQGEGSSRDLVIAELAATGLEDPARVSDSYPHQLSGGQRQRVLIAMALINRPDLVICDEPTTALDVTVQATVLRTLRQRLDDSRAACLFISHDLAVVASMCEQLVVMRHGEVVERGATAQVLADPQHGYTRSLIAAASLEDFTPGSRLPEQED